MAHRGGSFITEFGGTEAMRYRILGAFIEKGIYHTFAWFSYKHIIEFETTAFTPTTPIQLYPNTGFNRTRVCVNLKLNSENDRIREVANRLMVDFRLEFEENKNSMVVKSFTNGLNGIAYRLECLLCCELKYGQKKVSLL